VPAARDQQFLSFDWHVSSLPGSASARRVGASFWGTYSATAGRGSLDVPTWPYTVGTRRARAGKRADGCRSSPMPRSGDRAAPACLPSERHRTSLASYGKWSR